MLGRRLGNMPNLNNLKISIQLSTTYVLQLHVQIIMKFSHTYTLIQTYTRMYCGYIEHCFDPDLEMDEEMLR
jgi:hypothetical protein